MFFGTSNVELDYLAVPYVHFATVKVTTIYLPSLIGLYSILRLFNLLWMIGRSGNHIPSPLSHRALEIISLVILQNIPPFLSLMDDRENRFRVDAKALISFFSKCELFSEISFFE